MSNSLLFIQHGFGEVVTAAALPAVSVFQEAGEFRRGRSVSVKNTGAVRVYLLVNVSTDPLELANQFANLSPIPLEPGDAFVFMPDPEKGATYKNVGYTTVPGTGAGSASVVGSGGSGGAVETTLVIAVY